MHTLAVDSVDADNRAQIVLAGEGPEGVPIKLRADGIAIFEFNKVQAYSGGVVDPYVLSDGGHLPPHAKRQSDERDVIREKRFRYMNAFQSCFHVATNITNDLVPPSSRSHHIWAQHGGKGWTLQDNGAALINPPPFAKKIELARLEEALAAFRRIDSVDLHAALETLDLFYKVAFNLNHHEYQTVVILGWAIVEGCQDIIWKRFIDNGYKRINPHSQIEGKRKRLLLQDRNYTAAIKSQILALTGELSDHDLDSIDQVRKQRNSIMHSLEPSSVGDGFAAMRACGIVAKKALDLRLTSFGNPGGWDNLN